MSREKSSDVRKVTLVSQEGDEFDVDIEVASMSALIKTMVEEDSDCQESIPLPNVETCILKKIIEYCEHHYNNLPEEIPKPLKSSNLAEVVSEWDYQFINENSDQKILFALILAANYLNIKPLLDLSVAKVATMIKSKTPEEIRRIFNIVNDFTPEEEAQVREENKWCEDA
ncbi:putative suppressor of kinetochore protein 1 [Besnoitia besnoiti]|uniref:Putative suppressor of kinetochore protein 1 n=1 Tax=Besnoitia besnoiti TaxID=94643 RepID=A0A2A9M774_BESBE|nr:putative suppressor of kinetochore protein 1 [Besnoitia besnoiti]PFH31746.1 putative suppressor of kinetochore protein 1 [Besnoitia besnoiti]